MTHASVKGTLLEVPETVVRLSVGIEGVDDLIDDLLGDARPALAPERWLAALSEPRASLAQTP